MKYDPTTFFLMLSLISNSNESIKDKKKRLIKIAKRATGSHSSIINDILRNNNIVENISSACSAQLELFRLIDTLRDGGAQGVVLAGGEYYPIFVNIASEEDRVYSYEREVTIVTSASSQVAKGLPHLVGTSCTGMMFREDGFSGIAVSFKLTRAE